MYCSQCGSAMAGNLNYCQSCGFRNERNPMAVRNSSSSAMGIGAAFIGIVGLCAFYPILRELLHSSLDQATIVILMGLYVAAVFGMFSVLVGHVWKHSGDIRIKGAERADEHYSPPAFRGINTAQLEGSREKPASVTERTTRTLVDVPVDRN